MLFLSGGTGTPKLIRGFQKEFGENDLEVVANTADDIVISGNLVCPDLDTVTYTLAGLIDDDTWWGIKNDSFETHKCLKNLNQDEYMQIGDRDRAIHIKRSLLLDKMSLSRATEKITRELGVEADIFPMTDEKVRTKIISDDQKLDFQEWLIKKECEPEINNVVFEGIEKASPSNKLIQSLQKTKYVVIGPSNPITSIKPILSLKNIKKLFLDKKVLVVSPFINNRPFSGPADKLMKSSGFKPNNQGLINFYDDITDIFVFDKRNENPPKKGYLLDTYMETEKDEARLAREIDSLLRNK